MENKLTEINRNDLPVLQSLYDPNEPDTHISYTIIGTYIRWFEQNPDYTFANNEIKFFCLNGDFSRGTFAVIVSEFHFQINERERELANVFFLG